MSTVMDQLESLSADVRAAIEPLIASAVVEERQGLLALAREHCAQADALSARGRLDGVDCEALKARLTAFAEGVATGLHRDGHDLPGVRELMKSAGVRT